MHRYFVFSFLISAICGNVDIDYLKGVPRLNSISYWDYYFSCATTGQTLQWNVNEISLSGFSQVIAQVVSGNTSEFNYVATLLSLKSTFQGNFEHTSLLIVSSWGRCDLNVMCTNGSLSLAARNVNNGLTINSNTNSSSIFLDYVLTKNIVKSSDYSKKISIFVCGVQNFFLSWQVRRASFSTIGFTTGDKLGQERRQLQDSGNIIKQQGILIGKQPYPLVTALIIIDASEAFNVTCEYSGNEVSLSTQLSLSTLTTAPFQPTSATESVETTNDSTVNNNAARYIIIIGSIALVLVSTLVIIVIAMGIKIKMAQKRVPVTETRRENILEGEKISDVYELFEIPQEAISAEDNRRIKEYSNPIKLEEVSKLLRDNPSGQLIYEEHEFLRNITIKETKNETCNEGTKHMEKNKFEGFLPYDSSRVHLKPIDGVEGSDYINASFIDGYRRSQAYIAAQAPLSNTIFDFWRMINEYRVTTIVMFHDDECEQYWPESIEGVLTDDKTSLQVTYINREEFAYYGVRTFKLLKQSSHENPLYIKQYYFFNWSYDRKLRFHTPIIQLIQHVKSDYRKLGDNSPIVVQSIAGTGRASLFITLDAMMEQMNEKQAIGVFEFVRNMRHKRKSMMRNKDHYLHIYKILDELYTCGDTSVQANKLREKILELKVVNENTESSGFSVQFALLNKFSRQPKSREQSVALCRHNKSKNVSLKRVPYDENRVTLIPLKADSCNSDYINASYVGGYQHEDKYIATQVPLEGTTHDFWRMIWEYPQYQTIVFIGPLIEKHMAFHGFWPPIRKSRTYHQLTITTMSEEQEKDYTERIIHIKNAEESREVILYHYENWLEHEKPQNSTGILQLIDRLESHKQSSDSNGMVVMCSDGTTRTGAFITIHAMIRKAKTENVVDFFQFIMLLRIERTELVWELEHYIFCHEVLADYMERL